MAPGFEVAQHQVVKIDYQLIRRQTTLYTLTSSITS